MKPTITEARAPRQVAHQDGHGTVLCYPDGNGRGQLSRDFGTYGAIWVTATEEVGIFPGPEGEFLACPSAGAYCTRRFKTLRGAVGYMRRLGRDPYGRALPTVEPKPAPWPLGQVTPARLGRSSR